MHISSFGFESFFVVLFFSLSVLLGVFLIVSRHMLTKYWKWNLLCFLFDVIKATRYCIDSITHYTFRSLFCARQRSITHIQSLQIDSFALKRNSLVFRAICLHKLLKRNFQRVITSCGNECAECLKFWSTKNGRKRESERTKIFALRSNTAIKWWIIYCLFSPLRHKNIHVPNLSTSRSLIRIPNRSSKWNWGREELNAAAIRV